MKTIFETCVPRDEVLSGELREQQFAASLTKVLRGNADEIYGDAATFFANTYPTGGLKSLLREGLGKANRRRQRRSRRHSFGNKFRRWQDPQSDRPLPSLPSEGR